MDWIKDLLETLEIGTPVTSGSLTMVPLLGGAGHAPEYLTLDEALEAKLLRITEVDESGSVPELRLSNESDRQVFLLDGQELVGAKQNRVLNLSLLVPAHGRMDIPVSCVEQGRWRHDSRHFESSGATLHATGRASKLRSVSANLQVRGSFESDQGQVWDNVQDMVLECAAPSATLAFTEVHRRHAETLERHEKALQAVPGQTGVAFLVEGHLVSLDLFEHPSVLRKLLPALVRGNALETVRQGGFVNRPAEHAAKLPGLKRLLGRLVEATASEHPAPGLGSSVRLDGQDVAGAALRESGRVIHLAAFPAGVRSSRRGWDRPRRRSGWLE